MHETSAKQQCHLSHIGAKQETAAYFIVISAVTDSKKLLIPYRRLYFLVFQLAHLKELTLLQLRTELKERTMPNSISLQEHRGIPPLWQERQSIGFFYPFQSAPNATTLTCCTMIAESFQRKSKWRSQYGRFRRFVQIAMLTLIKSLKEAVSEFEMNDFSLRIKNETKQNNCIGLYCSVKRICGN